MDSEVAGEYLQALAHEQRRDLLRELRAEGETTLSEFATTRTPPLETELHHRHVPRLVDAGLVEYDADSGTIRTGENFDDVVVLLEAVDELLGSGGPTE